MKEEKEEKTPQNCVYILTNQSMPDIIKVGLTGNLENRMKSLDKTSTPLPFECYYAVEVLNGKAKVIEDKAHEGLDDKRVRPNREFFYATPEQAKSILEIAEVMGGKDITPREDIVETPQDQQALDKARKKHKAIDYFGVLAIPKGTILTFSKDETITCEVAEGGQVIFRGEQTSMSRSALIVLNEMGYDWTKAGGPEYWCYQGETLRNLYSMV